MSRSITSQLRRIGGGGANAQNEIYIHKRLLKLLCSVTVQTGTIYIINVNVYPELELSTS